MIYLDAKSKITKIPNDCENNCHIADLVPQHSIQNRKTVIKGQNQTNDRSTAITLT